MEAGLAWCLLVTGCAFHKGNALVEPPDAPDVDVAVDVSLCTTWMPRHFDACTIPAPTGPLNISGDSTFNTDTGMLDATTPAGASITQASGPDVYVLSVDGVTIEATGTLHVIGSKPLIIASWQAASVAGTIDAGSSAMQIGAGSNPATCSATAAQPGQIAVSTGGSGGGGGGGFGGHGGHGGTGDNPQGPLGGAGGASQSVPRVVIGACSGAASGAAGPGDSGDPNATSPGGAGAGAIELASRVSIAITGHVRAGGAGGGGAPTGSAAGGGGGGAGGYLGFDAATISFDGATIAANGGGGGGSAPFAGTGMAGQDGQPSAAPAAGGPLSTCSEPGMAGGAGATPDGASSANPVESCGGAGGGGGVGFVLTWGTVTQSGTPTISPAAQAGPPAS